jgi:alpha-D-ribose 1-methylphosphonate 5-triphosphate synthase subunit PhnI
MERPFCKQLQIKGQRLFKSIEEAQANEPTFLQSWSTDFVAHVTALQQQITDISVANGTPAATFDEIQKSGQALCSEIDYLQKLSDAGLWNEEQRSATQELTSKVISLRKMAVGMIMSQTATKEDMNQMKARANSLRRLIEEAQNENDPDDLKRNLQKIAGHASRIGQLARSNQNKLEFYEIPRSS